ncbi:MAG: histidine triad nucleotide-binding protein [Chloroflexi bacterium]|nr:histidine triad nucleotide-binding protein [Chloroflexota bacterium]
MWWTAEEEKQQLRQPDCLFCRIVHGELPSTQIYEDEQCVAFNDINPVANVHALIVPREHVTYLIGATEQHEPLIGHLMRVGARVARQTGIEDAGYRLAVNQGVDAGQIVEHLHIHVLGGGQLDQLGTPLGPI